MTVREINELTRDGGNGRNVYVRRSPGDNTRLRITGARTRKGRMEVRLLCNGAWIDATDALIEESL